MSRSGQHATGVVIPGRNQVKGLSLTGIRHVALVGPTASGKSALALAAAEESGWEIVSVDSMQVYRGMDIGTAKASSEERARVPHHLIDIVDPQDEMTLAEFVAAVNVALQAVESRGRRAILVGGTGLYLQAVVDGLQLPGRYPEVAAQLETEATADLFRRLSDLDPAAVARMEPDNRRRIVRALEVTIGSGEPFSSYGPGLGQFPANDRFLLVGVWLPRDVLARRIEARVTKMVEAGWRDEVRRLQSGGGWGRTAGQALGYREMAAHLRSELSLAEAMEETVRKTRAFSRRQRVWFRRDPRIRWRATAEDPRRLLPAILRDLESAPTGAHEQ